MNDNGNRPSQRQRMTREQYEKRRKMMRRKRLFKRIRAALILVILIVVIVLLIALVAKGCGSKTPSDNTPETDTAAESADQSGNNSSSDQTGADSTEPTTPVVQTGTKPEFVADLSAYEKYMEPEDATEYLILLNAKNKVDASYAPTDLMDIANTRADGRPTRQLREYAAKSLDALFLEAQAEGVLKASASGYPLSVMSTYRSYSEQSNLFASYTSTEMQQNASLTKEAAEAIVLTYCNYPGTSEHQTGLAVDMHDLPGADQSFANSDAYTWLTENAWKFGFILRYPEDKTEITGVSFEPWHYRYVGRYHAEQIKKAGLCLEEYLAQLG